MRTEELKNIQAAPSIDRAQNFAYDVIIKGGKFNPNELTEFERVIASELINSYYDDLNTEIYNNALIGDDTRAVLLEKCEQQRKEIFESAPDNVVVYDSYKIAFQCINSNTNLNKLLSGLTYEVSQKQVDECRDIIQDHFDGLILATENNADLTPEIVSERIENFTSQYEKITTEL